MTVSIHDCRDGAVTITITDNGDGIEADQLDDIFERIYRADGSGRPQRRLDHGSQRGIRKGQHLHSDPATTENRRAVSTVTWPTPDHLGLRPRGHVQPAPPESRAVHSIKQFGEAAADILLTTTPEA